jgi:hypothetical protein
VNEPPDIDRAAAAAVAAFPVLGRVAGAQTSLKTKTTAGIVFNDDWGQLSETAFLHDFVGNLPPEEARVLYAVQQPFRKSLTTEKTTNAAWRTKPSFYGVSTQDRTINPDLERFMAKRMGAKTIEINASHWR